MVETEATKHEKALNALSIACIITSPVFYFCLLVLLIGEPIKWIYKKLSRK